MHLFVCSPNGTKRVECTCSDSPLALAEKIRLSFELDDDMGIEIYRDKQQKDMISLKECKTLSKLQLKHADILYVLFKTSQVENSDDKKSKSRSNESSEESLFDKLGNEEERDSLSSEEEVAEAPRIHLGHIKSWFRNAGLQELCSKDSIECYFKIAGNEDSMRAEDFNKYLTKICKLHGVDIYNIKDSLDKVPNPVPVARCSKAVRMTILLKRGWEAFSESAQGLSLSKFEVWCKSVKLKLSSKVLKEAFIEAFMKDIPLNEIPRALYIPKRRIRDFLKAVSDASHLDIHELEEKLAGYEMGSDVFSQLQETVSNRIFLKEESDDLAIMFKLQYLGAIVSSAAKNEFMKLRKEKKYRYIIYHIKDKVIDVEVTGPRDATYGDFLEQLQKYYNECRYCVFEFPAHIPVKSDSQVELSMSVDRVVLITWRPEAAPDKMKIMYFRSADELKEALGSVWKCVEVRHLEDASQEAIEVLLSVK